ncbi:MAG: hypothetical protein ACK4YV_04180 [Emticicia sp.]
MKTIISAKLTKSDIPKEKAVWSKIVPFALSLDLAEIAKTDISIESNLDTLTISDLRFILYIEQRRYNHFGREPDGETMRKIHLILDLIRKCCK